MIREVYYMAEDRLTISVGKFNPPAIINELYGAVYFNDGQKIYKFPEFVKPVLALHNDTPKAAAAEKIVNFLQLIHATNMRWTLFIACESGRTKSASVARFIKAVDQSIRVEGLDDPSKGEKHNTQLSICLAAAWGQEFARQFQKKMEK